MALFDGRVIQLSDLRDRQVEAVHSLLKLDERLNLVWVGQLLGAQVLDLFLELHRHFFENGRL